MLQRIQTLFLLLAAAAMLTASVTPLASFSYNGDEVLFEAMGIYLNGTLSDSTWGLFVIGVVVPARAGDHFYLQKEDVADQVLYL